MNYNRVFIRGDTHGDFSWLPAWCIENHTTTDDALIIVDNIFVRGLITDDNVENRNKRKLRDKVRNFNQAMKDSEYSTSFLNVGDGLLVIY